MTLKTVDKLSVLSDVIKPCILGTPGGCLLPEAENTGWWRCTICREVSQWVDSGHRHVVIASANPTGVRVFPAHSCEKAAGWLFILDVDTMSLNQLRLILQHIAETVNLIQVWESDTQQFRVIHGWQSQPPRPAIALEAER